jgi:hypothetical protein
MAFSITPSCLELSRWRNLGFSVWGVRVYESGVKGLVFGLRVYIAVRGWGFKVLGPG